MTANKYSIINTLSLFTGAGGLDIGFHDAGFNILGCVELEKKYCDSLEKNKAADRYISKTTNIHNIDINDFDASQYSHLNIQCIIGGPPCQTFSAAGRRSGGVIGTDDIRGKLYEAYCEILDVIKPKVFVFENVYGLPGANGGEPWKEIVKAFSRHGYKLHAEVVDAADYGVPQHRERLIMIGTKQLDYIFPMPTVGPDSVSNLPLVSVYDAIKDLQNRSEISTESLGGLYGHLLRDVPEGLNYSFFTAEMGHPEPVFAWRSKFHDLLYKVKKDEPCRTIKANPGKFTGPFHWKNRHFTVEELKRLQTFPDDYQLVGSYGQILEQIGNSVPPKLAYVIAQSIKEQIFNIKADIKLTPRPADFKSTFRQRQRERSREFNTIAHKAIKAKYGKITIHNEPLNIKPKLFRYYVKNNDIFYREVLKKNDKTIPSLLSVVVTETGNHIRIDCDKNCNKLSSSIVLKIDLSGLGKYLSKFDTLSFNAEIYEMQDMFQYWREIEACLIDRSNFFTLIDIYGHYANRGDTVNIYTDIAVNKKSDLWRTIEYFSQTINCGKITDIKLTAKSLSLTTARLLEIVSEMRGLRYDIRTFSTHPIIGENSLLCTYPFPLLSPRALVESKVKLSKKGTHEK